MKLRYLPVGIDVGDAPVLVVGAGKVALQKIQVLLLTRARLTVVAPEVMPEIRRLSRRGRLVLEERRYRAADVRGRRLVISATDDRALNERIRRDGNRAGVLVNVVDVRDLCDYIFMSLFVRRGYVAAFSTDAQDPGRTKKLRLFLEGKIDEHCRCRYQPSLRRA